MTDLSADDVLRIASSPVWRQHRIERTASAAGPVVVKGVRPRRGAWARWTLRTLAVALREPLIAAPPMPGGLPGQALEVHRLRCLAAAGVPVPGVVHVGADHFVMQQVAGLSVAEWIDRGGEAAWRAWCTGTHALSQVHQRGQYLSQAFARNLIVNGDPAEGPVVFIDFEDDPGAVMSLADAQARDWLCWLHSTVWRLPERRAQMAALCRDELNHLSPALEQSLRRASRRLAVLRHLPARRQPWGRDVVSVQGVASLLFDFSAVLFPDAASGVSRKP